MSGPSRNDVHLSHNVEGNRYELRLDGEMAGTAEYLEQSGGGVALTQTVMADPYQHRGFSSMLVRYAVEDIMASGRQIEPYCSYAAAWLGKHPEYSHYVSWPQAPRQSPRTTG